MIRSLLPHADHEPVALGAAGVRTAGQFLGDVARISLALRGLRSGEVAIACGDRYLLAVALLATWSEGRAAAFPPNGQEGSVRALEDLDRTAILLHDRDHAATGVDVRSLLVGPPPAVRGLPEVEASRHLVTIWTSGSTGAPLPHGKSAGQLLGEASLLRDALGVGPGCRVVATVPSLHIYGLLFGVLVPLAARGAFARESPLHAEAVAAVVRATAATHLVSTPAHLRGLLVLDSFPGTIRAFSSGAALADAVRAELSTRLGLAVTEVYGSTETGGIGVRDAMGAAWRPLPGVSVALDEEGCLVIDSPFLGRDVERPFPVGDRASLESGGFRLLGRADGVVKVAGKRVALAEVEARLLDVPGVTDAVAIAVPVAGARDIEILAVVAGADLEEPAIRAALLRWLDPVSLPRRIRMLDRLPRGSGGKIPRDVVLALFQPDAGVLGFEIRAGGPDAPAFLGHFDGAPVLPGYVQIIELVLAPARRRWPDLAGLRKVKRLKFRRPIVPGETLRVRIVRTSSAQRIDFEIMDRLAACSSGTLEFGAPP